MQTKIHQRAEHLLAEARQGSNECWGHLLGLYTNYLRLLVLTQIERRLAARVSPSDLVQETFFEAHRDFHQFRGETAGEFLAWLRRILVNNLHRVIEHHILAEKRDVRREVSVDQLACSLERSAARLDAVFADPGSSPDQRAERHELQLVVADELANFPADYRDVILLRHVEGLPFDEIGRRMQRTSGAARMLWMRAIQSLRERLTARGLL
jgi:RNA polymerase sigma-70 factor (ECF subfamily)